MSRDDVERAAWAIEPGGRRFRGAAAINRAFAELPGGPRRVAALYRVPPLRWLEDAGYVVVARTRHRLSALTRTAPECDDAGVDCGP